MSNELYEVLGDLSVTPLALTGEPSSPMTVSQVTNCLKATVDELFANVCVVGEISNYSLPRSGHVYLTLKDESAQLSAVIWKSTMQKLPFDLKNGMQIVCCGRIEIYPPHGKYQLIVSKVEPLGVGALELAFQQLQEKLRREGLFDPARKKTPPRIIRRIGVATSATGAAIRDFLNILGRRTKRVDVVVAPTKVQGEDAAQDVVRALRLLNEQRETLQLDAIVLIRGGGSVEDLWTFNEEIVVREIAASRLPVVTGIGHEIDVSLSDLAADVHALTPSDAADRHVSEDDAFIAALDDWKGRLLRGVEQKLKSTDDRLRFLEQRHVFIKPYEVLYEKRVQSLDNLADRMNRRVDETLERLERRIVEAAAKLEAMSPLAVLGRGYSLTKRTSDGKLLRRPSEVVPGETIETLLADGCVRSVVIE